ncbi:hypothetical protein BDU57DRAFT_515170 [Ampelomyces quisqualis]|uniref:EH domain-containing protein n=1 Tax=Ampelomyces quisqualis TaxID=50730 RepID=A0A6A5QU69_AMPQU|nr:hypothetical protein BDU57DRAFT_515170 [Ampelomyces quisqualis]
MSYVSKHSSGDTHHNVRDAALHGAVLAFSKPPAKPTPVSNASQYGGGNHGALLAAAKVGSPRHAAAAAAGSPAPLTRDWTGSRSVSSQSVRRAGSTSSSSNTLAVPEDHPDGRPSPSNIAARLAAARYSPLPRAPQPAANTSMMSERHANERHVLPRPGSVGSVLARLEPKKARKPTGDTEIPPTTSPGKIVEQTRSDTPTKPTAAVPMAIAQHSPPLVRSPKPQRTFKLPPEPIGDAPLARQRTRTPPLVKPKPKHQIGLPRAQFTDGAPSFNTSQKDPIKLPPIKLPLIKQKPGQLTASTTSTTPPPKPPPQRGSRQARPKSEELKRVISTRRTVSTSMESDKGPSSPASFKSAKEVWDEEEKQKPSVPPPRRSNTRKLDTVPAATKPLPSAPVPIASRRQNQFPSPLRLSAHFSPPRRPTSTSGTSPGSVYHNNYQRDSVRQITKHMTGESLSSAIVGAALASSRNVSPAPPQPITIEPLFPSRKQHHRHHSPFHRSPSPQKQSQPKVVGKMRTTMRKDPSSSEDEDKVERYKKKGTRIMGIKGRKHPNKHHEGTRKRWRDQITDRERKRYEGVWAANKGLHIPPTTTHDNDTSQDVLNYTAQEIWLRSRLPVHVLEEVWDLVDSRAIGRLKRNEFVVGLWLIDQRLKGRKLPIRVSESVWTSARGLGIKVKVRS